MREMRTVLTNGFRRALTVGAMAGAMVGATLTGGTTAYADQPHPSAQWAQFKNDPSRRGVTTVVAPTNPGVAWSSGTGGAIVSGPVIAADGTVIVATNNGRIRAIKPDGSDRWQREVAGSNFFSQPFINQRGFVVFGAADGTIRAFDTANGDEKWKFPADADLGIVGAYGGGNTPARGAPVSSKEYGRTLIPFDGGFVFEIDEDGRWKGVRLATGNVEAPPMITANSLIVWATTDKNVYGGNSFGGDRWQIAVDAAVVSGPVGGPDSTVYVSTLSGTIYALDSNKGEIKWKRKVANGGIRSTGSLAADGTLYVGSDDGKLYAIDTNNSGAEKWNYATGAPITSSPLISANGMIYVGSNDSNVYVLNTAGQRLAAIKTDQGIDYSSPAIATDGTVYIGSKDGRLYALKQVGPMAPTVATGTAMNTAVPVASSVATNAASGTISLNVTGRLAPIELRPGIATSTPDAYCPTVRYNTYIRLDDEGIRGATFGVGDGGILNWVTPDQAGCVDWSAISANGRTFTKEVIMRFQLAAAAPGALLWVLDGAKQGNLYEVDGSGVAKYVSGDQFASQQAHFRQVWANVIPVSTNQINGLAAVGKVG
jgi:outer membrane protein assembly factor BamB